VCKSRKEPAAVKADSQVETGVREEWEEVWEVPVGLEIWEDVLSGA
jgi:hypothetical protein